MRQVGLENRCRSTKPQKGLSTEGCWRRRLLIGCGLMPMLLTGCGLFTGGSQLKQLQLENDRLVSEYRAQRDRIAKLQATNADLEARVGEAEKLLASSGQNLPSSRLSQIPNRSSGSGSSGLGLSAPSSLPPYTPPHAALDESGGDSTPKWRPATRQ